MSDIRQKLNEYYGADISCVCSDINAEELVCRIKLNTDSEDVLTELKALEHNILEKITIKGFDNIEKVFINKQENLMYDPISKSQVKQDEWVVYTEGTNMADMLSHPLIDCTKLYSNNVKEVYEVLGIEAARQALYNEIQEVLESITVNYRHISHLVDVQTNKGFLLSIDRHGINRGDIGPLAKCSFEETTEKLIKAGIFAEHDNINGVSANIMLGQVVPAGTGTVEVIVDETMLPSIMEEVEILNNEDPVDEICDPYNFSIDFKIPKAKVNNLIY
jgi:DNA-directed RNA polymerase II subunit RPB1